jgi:hypothetical protein
MSTLRENRRKRGVVAGAAAQAHARQDLQILERVGDIERRKAESDLSVHKDAHHQRIVRRVFPSTQHPLKRQRQRSGR